MTQVLSLTQDDNSLILMLSASAGCSLDSSPKSNWVEKGGGLPNYICQIAKGVMKSGKSKSQAIAIAVSRVKAWAAGGDDVEAGTQAKAAKALAQWNTLKGRNKAKKISLSRREDGAEYLMFSNTTSFNTEIVRAAWEDLQREKRKAEQVKRRAAGQDPYESEIGMYSWVKELWTDYLIATAEGSSGVEYVKVPYTVDDSNNVTFGDPTIVHQVWEEVEAEELSDNELELLMRHLELSAPRRTTASERIMELSNRLRG
jgi:hypothetical protein